MSDEDEVPAAGQEPDESTPGGYPASIPWPPTRWIHPSPWTWFSDDRIEP